MPTPELHKVYSVTATNRNQVFIVDCDITDAEGLSDRVLYCSAPDDPFGLNPTIRQWLIDNEGAYVIEPYIPPAPVPVVYQISKTTPWLRMTEDEAATMDGIMSETGARLKQIYMAATYLASDDPLWQTLHEMLANAFGTTRADQLLAPET